MDGYAVNETLPFAPSPFMMLGENFHFPLLALYREKSTLRYESQDVLLKTSSWILEYVLPPLSLLGLGKLEGARAGVDAVFFNCISLGAHPAYNDGYSLSTLGLIDFGGDDANSTYGLWEIQSQESFLAHPVIVFRFTTTEKSGFSTDYPSVPFEGVDAEIEINPEDPLLVIEQSMEVL